MHTRTYVSAFADTENMSERDRERRGEGEKEGMRKRDERRRL